ncbi:hypothetical protein B0I35DRAFT_445354 [Stachybotrys elegans]|uniref:Uncharacterized protein n=1 Tax=Stachybotrys elegans TaxID=80388 RepID=A0A8K0SEQ1_9HYPO|nr:hypothetical protein B0I35DRAFT_445354 [Stachybotrys elegans]
MRSECRIVSRLHPAIPAMYPQPASSRLALTRARVHQDAVGNQQARECCCSHGAHGKPELAEWISIDAVIENKRAALSHDRR